MRYVRSAAVARALMHYQRGETERIVVELDAMVADDRSTVLERLVRHGVVRGALHGDDEVVGETLLMGSYVLCRATAMRLYSYTMDT